MEKWKYGIPLLLIAIAGVYMYSAGMPTGISDGLHYTGIACITAVQSGVFHDYGCQHNLITTRGLNLIKFNMMGVNQTIKVGTLAIANSTSPQLITDTELNNQETVAGCGLANVSSTLTDIGTGNWSVSHTWTSACNGRIINATGIYNTTAVGNLFAEANFTSVTLNNGDQLTVTYYTWVQ